MDQSESFLIQQAQAGDTAAFETLVNQHAQLVYNLALRTLNNPHEAEDIAQETFVRVWKALPSFREDARFSTWLYRITTNLCYNRLPKLKQELTALDPAEDVQIVDRSQRVDRQLITAELREDLQDALNGLSESYRLLLTLRHLQGLSYAEIAEVTDMPLGTVKTGIFRARREMREALSNHSAFEMDK